MGQPPRRSNDPARPSRNLDDQGDSELVELVRQGNTRAFGVLWQRHAAPGKAVARSYSASLDADDLVAEAFTKIFQSIQSGKGPSIAFRAYLFTTIRNVASSWGRSSRESPSDELDDVASPTSLEDESLAALDRSLTATAFHSLPTRWQEVLWYSEVERLTAGQIAPLLGMKANAVYALAFRAREGLREAWIQAHISSVAEDSECRWSIERLGSHALGKLASRDQSRLDNHLAECSRCSIIASEAHEVGSRLALILLPLMAGVGGAAAYTTWSQTGGASSLLAALEPVGPPPAVVSASFAKPAKSLSTGATIALGAAVTVGLVGGVAFIVPLVSSAPDVQNLAQQVAPPAPAPVDEVDVVAPESAQSDVVPGPVSPALPDVRPDMAPSPSPAPAPTETPTFKPNPQPNPQPKPTPKPTPKPSPSLPPSPQPTPTPEPQPTTPPIVLPSAPGVISPAAGAALRRDTMTVEGTGVVGNTVQIVVGDPSTGRTTVTAIVDAAGTWSAVVGPLANGTHPLTITQSTPDGATSKPAVRSVTIDILRAPTGTISAPNDHFVPWVRGQAEPFAIIEVLNGANLVIDRTSADAAGNWSIDAVDGLAFGPQTMAVRQTDRAGNVSPSTAAKPLNLQKIEVSISQGPEVGPSATVTVTGDPGVAFEALVDGVATGNQHSINFDGTWSGRLMLSGSTATLGPHRLSVRYANAPANATRFGPKYTIDFIVADPADAPPSGSGPLDPL